MAAPRKKAFLSDAQVIDLLFQEDDDTDSSSVIEDSDNDPNYDPDKHGE